MEVSANDAPTLQTNQPTPTPGGGAERAPTPFGAVVALGVRGAVARGHAVHLSRCINGRQGFSVGVPLDHPLSSTMAILDGDRFQIARVSQSLGDAVMAQDGEAPDRAGANRGKTV
jgi:hypothetical protein